MKDDRYSYVGFEVVKRPYTNAARIPPQTSTVATKPPLKITGVPNLHSGFHTANVPAANPPPAEATAPIMSCRKKDWERRGSGWERTSSRAVVMDPSRTIASIGKRKVSNRRGKKADGMTWKMAVRKKCMEREATQGFTAYS